MLGLSSSFVINRFTAHLVREFTWDDFSFSVCFLFRCWLNVDRI